MTEVLHSDSTFTMPAMDTIDASTPPQLAVGGEAQVSNEEWEGWMRWDNVLEATSPKSSDLSPPPLRFVSGSTGSTSPSELDSLSGVQYSPVYSLPPANKPAPVNKKRKSSVMVDTPTGIRQPRGHKISHNVIEKRYRSNLNDKIAKLRDCVPDLRTASPTVKKRNTKATGKGWDGSDDEGDQGLKFNKATVLVKATEYIQQLERQNQRLQSELTALKSRGGSLEKLRNPPAITTGAAPVPIISTPPSFRRSLAKPMSGLIPTVLEPTERSTATSTPENPAGMIQIPDDIKRMRDSTAAQAHYGSSFASSNNDQNCPSSPVFPTEVRGIIPIPEDLRRFREEAASQAHYAPESSYYGNYVSPQDTVYTDDDPDATSASWPRSKAMSRVLVGSLVGLMFMESFSENEPSSSDPDKPGIRSRGLFSLPTELLTESRGFRAPIRQRIIAFLASPASGKAASILLVSAVFMALFFAIFMYLAPRETKNVREGPVHGQPQQMASMTTVASSLAPAATAMTEDGPPVVNSTQPGSTYLPPNSDTHSSDDTPNRTLVAVFDQLATDWLGMDWFRSHHLDEEAARKEADAGDAAVENGKLLPLERLIPPLLYQRQNAG